MEKKDIIINLLLENNSLLKKNKKYSEELKEKIQENSLLKIELEKKNDEIKKLLSEDDDRSFESIVSFAKDTEKRLEKLERQIYSRTTKIILNEDEKKYLHESCEINLEYEGNKKYFHNSRLFGSNEKVSALSFCCLDYSSIYHIYYHDGKDICEDGFYRKKNGIFVKNISMWNMMDILLKNLAEKYPRISEYIIFADYQIKDSSFEYSYVSGILRTYVLICIIPFNKVKNDLPILEKYSKYLKIISEYKGSKIFYYDIDCRYSRYMYEDCQKYFITN